ncbi:MAG: aconitase family protein [Planctomycetota bacterium]
MDKIKKLASTLTFRPRILTLTADLAKVRSQLDGQAYAWDGQEPLVDNISTDELTPGWVCFYYDETLGDYVYVGLRGGVIKKDDVKKGDFEVVVSGLSKGCGSSRETAPFAEQCAGIRLVVAKTIEKIYGQNCLNIGLLTTTDFGVLDRIKKGESIPLSEFTKGLDPISKDIVEYGGLFPYNQARLKGEVTPPAVNTAPRPMNLVEKIIARHAIADAKTGRLGVEAVKPGDALFVMTDVRFTHDYVTAMAGALFKKYLGNTARIKDPSSTWAFRDHLTFLGKVMPEERKKKGFLTLAENLATVQESFCREQGIRLYGEVPGQGSEAICHNAVLEDIGLPGQIIIGTDSHTCTGGALGAFAYGVGSTDMANSWFTKDTRLTVPNAVRYNLKGRLRKGVAAKDLMLHVMAADYIKSGKAIGKVLEFGGEGIASLSLDERATITNMAVEAGATTGIIEADEVVVDYIHAERGLSKETIRAGLLRADADATYDATFTIDLSAVEPMVATPGDPRNGIPISKMTSKVKVNIAYGGSCTGGKKADMDMYADVLRGKTVSKDVKLYIQFGSQKIKKYAQEKGYIELFQKSGAELIDPSCGACINAGPGVSLDAQQVTVSAINRNFPGRSGPGQVYLASPRVVAASAVAGEIAWE